GLLEALEDAPELLLVDPLAGVGHRHLDVVVAPPRREPDTVAGARELDRVGDQVLDDLAYAARVVEDGRQVALNVEPELAVLGGVEDRGSLVALLERAVERPSDALYADLAGGYARHVEQVVQQLVHAVGDAAERPHALEDLVLRRAGLEVLHEHVREPDD